MTQALIHGKHSVMISPTEMLYALMKEFMEGRTVPQDMIDRWEDLGDRRRGIGQEERFDYLINILGGDSPSKMLKAMDAADLLTFCLPLCFPLRKSRQKRELAMIIDGFDLCQGDLTTKVNIFLFPFVLERVRETLELANFDPDTIRMMIVAHRDVKKENSAPLKGTHPDRYVDNLNRQLNRLGNIEMDKTI